MGLWFAGFSVIAFLVLLEVAREALAQRRRKGEKRRFEAQRDTLSSDKILNKWSEVVEGAAGRGEKTLDEIVRRIRKAEIPSVQFEKREVSFEGGSREPCIVVSDEELTGYGVFVGTSDYGNNLNVMWFLAYDSPGGVFLRRRERLNSPELKNKMLHAARYADGQKYISRDKLPLAKKERLENYSNAILEIVKEKVKEIEEGFDKDFTQEDEKSKGFTNIS